MAGETLDNVDFTRISMDDVERIEIVKGAASSLYGSNAVGGVINVITKKPIQPWSLRLNSKWGSHKEHRYGINAAFKAKKLASSTTLQKNGQDPIDLGENSAYKAYGYDTWNLKEKLSYQFNPIFSLSGHAGYFIRERHYSETQDNRFRDFSVCSISKGRTTWRSAISLTSMTKAIFTITNTTFLTTVMCNTHSGHSTRTISRTVWFSSVEET